jgi:hypothetical protein
MARRGERRPTDSGSRSGKVTVDGGATEERKAHTNILRSTLRTGQLLAEMHRRDCAMVLEWIESRRRGSEAAA